MKSVYLYIKKHSVSGKLYFGKTVKDPEKYQGSGTYWGRHCRKNGLEHIETPWYCLFTEQEELTKFALMCSKQWDIVNSKDWLNLIPENGIDGGVLGLKQSAAVIENRAIKLRGKKRTPEQNTAQVIRQTGSKQKKRTPEQNAAKSKRQLIYFQTHKRPPTTDETRAKQRKPKSDAARENMSIASKNKVWYYHPLTFEYIRVLPGEESIGFVKGRRGFNSHNGRRRRGEKELANRS